MPRSVLSAYMMSANSSSNGAGTGRGPSRGGSGSGDTATRMSVITKAAWDLRVTKCEVAKGDLNEVDKRLRGIVG